MKIKRTLSLILALVLAFSAFGIAASAKLTGDVNNDGKVNSSDALMVLQYSVGSLKKIDTDAADVNDDGKINSTDALMVLKISVGLLDTSKYKATVKLTATANGKSYTSSDTISVKAGNTVSVTLSLKTNYYTGPTSAQLYYNSAIFSSAPSAKFNTDGKLYEATGKSFCTFVDWDDMAQQNKEECWPDYSADKLETFKATHKFLRVTMTPNVMQTDKAPYAINEDLVTIEFKVSSSAKKGATGQIIIPIESRRTIDYLDGHLMCSVHPNESITSKPSPYVDGLAYDCTNAVLNFKVA